MAQDEAVATVRPPAYNPTVQPAPKPQQHRRRPRVPQAYGFVDCIKRSLGALLDTLIIVISIRFSVMWPQVAGFGVPGILGGFVALILDVSDVVGTLDRSRRIARPSAPLTFCMDVIIFLIFIIGIPILIFTGFEVGSDPDRQPPGWQKERMLCFWIVVAGACWRAIYLIWGCIDRKARRKEDRAIHAPVAIENLPSNQPPRYSFVDGEQPQSASTPRPAALVSQRSASATQPNLPGPRTTVPPNYTSVARRGQSQT